TGGLVHVSPRDRGRTASGREPHESLQTGRASRLGARDAGADELRRAAAATARDRPPQPARAPASTRRRPSGRRGVAERYGEPSDRRRRRGAVPGRVRRLAPRRRDSGDRLRGRAGRVARPLCAPPAGPRGAPPLSERRQAVLTGPGRRRRGGRTYSTRVTAARLCVVSSPLYGAS